MINRSLLRSECMCWLGDFMSKIIIDTRSALDDIRAISAVIDVIKMGRKSNNGKQFCYLTTFNFPKVKHGIAVATDLNKLSDKFIVTDMRS